MRTTAPIKLDNVRAAKEAGLVYVSDDSPGITRRKQGSKFAYLDARGKPIKDRQTLDRIRMLAIPPAYRDVWICANERGHIQAVGRDDRGRKQYRYHEKWREVRDENKYGRMIDFAKALPRIRQHIARDLKRPGLAREKVLAAVVKFMEMTLIRVGNDEYAKLNRSFGLTTLQDRHAKIQGSAVTFRFRGKSGLQHEIGLRDRRLAGVVKRCRDLPGRELFQYVDDHGQVQDIASDDVNAYLAAVAPGFTAKEFRTWAGTVLAYRALRSLGKGSTDREKQKNVNAAIQATASNLGNTAAVARQAYIHPAVVDAYFDGRIRSALVEAAEDTDQAPGATEPDEERAVIALLRARLREDADRVRAGRSLASKAVRATAARGDRTSSPAAESANALTAAASRGAATQEERTAGESSRRSRAGGGGAPARRPGRSKRTTGRKEGGS
jgi:DNA topoisomerase I